VISRNPGRAATLLLLFLTVCAEPARPAVEAPSPQLRALAARAETRSNWIKLLRFAESQKNPEQRGLAFFVLGYAEFDADKTDLALRNFRKAAATRFSLTDFAEFYLASAAQEANHAEIVLQALADFSSRFPESTLKEDAAELYARTLLASGQARRAVEVLTTTPRVRQNPSLALLLADAYRAAGSLEDAARIYQEIYYAFPTSGEARTASKALDSLRTQLGDKFPNVPEKIQTARCEKLFARASYAEALKDYEALLHAHPSSALADRWKVGRARCLFRLRRASDALDQLQQPFSDRPGMDAERMAVLVDIYARQDDPTSMDLMIDQLAKLYASSRHYASALDTAGDYFVRQGDWQRAAQYYRPLATLFPDSSWGLEANWRVAWSYYLQKNFAAARAAFEDHLKRYPDSWHGAGGLYWLARMAEDHGAGGAAGKLYQALVKESGHSYYAALAGQRLIDLADRRSGLDSNDAGNWPLVSQVADRIQEVNPPISPCLPQQPSEEIERFRIFRAVSLDDVAEAYLRAVIAHEPARTDLRLALSRFEMEQGDLGPSVVDAVRAVRNYPDFGFDSLPKGVWDLLYPRAYWNLVRREARAKGLNPYLVMGLIRQESTFNPRAVSVANARGLMQILPQTVTRSRKRQRTVARRLLSPSYNVRTGTGILRGLSGANDGKMELALAAYHAGQSRVNTWRSQYAYRDPAEFLESIPIPSTRGYVERVMRDAAVYRKLLTGTARFADCRASNRRPTSSNPTRD
jgi:soluble lytic murein transglycosylase